MVKIKKIIICLMISFILLPSGSVLASSPGSASDPLVTKSWAQDYIDNQFAPLEEELAELKKLALKWAGGNSVDIQLFLNSNVAYVNGERNYIDPDRPQVKPQVKHNSSGGGYTMVPVRFVTESLGVDVQWKQSTQQIIFTDGSDTIIIKLNDKTATINGKRHTMGYAPFASDQRTYVHIRFIAEAFDCEVGWDYHEQRVDINR